MKGHGTEEARLVKLFLRSILLSSGHAHRIRHSGVLLEGGLPSGRS